jgi:transposase
MEWRFTTMDLQELVRRFQAGETRNAISRTMSLSVNTVTRYRRWAERQGLLASPLPDLATLERLRLETREPARPGRLPNESSLEPYRSEVADLLESGRQPRAIWTLLQKHHPGLVTSEATVWRLVQSIRASQPPQVVGRIETAPGEVAQVDFGYVGCLRDPRTGQKRKAWAFVLVLAWSRHLYAELVFDQKIATWLICHQHAFEFFHAVPRRIVLDNLKAAIIRAYTQDDDPAVQQSYRECAEHYGFLIDPCLPRRPEHKGKVERGGVGYLKQSFLPLLEGEPTLTEANRQLRQWLLETAARRVHGTTHAIPWERFTQTEWLAMLPEPVAEYDPAVWKRVHLHRDGHVTFERAYYSAPHRLVGQTLWLRAGLRDVRLLTERFELVASHPRAQTPGERFTQPDHLPAHLAAALATTRDNCQTRADAIGPATAQVVRELLASRPVDRLRTALRVLHLAEQFAPARLEAACERGLVYADTQFITLKRLLQAGREGDPLPTADAGCNETPALVFARSPEELAQAILGGAPGSVASWN